MIIAKAPFRISFFGGSTDYEEFYKEHGSFLIGTTIDKYVYMSLRKRPLILPRQSVITYSQLQHVKTWDEINNPLIREILKHCKINIPIEFNSYSDIPSRTGLGGSSSFAVGMLYLIKKVFEPHQQLGPRELAQTAIFIERTLLKEAGGIQDQIWPAYGGLSTIEIPPDGKFLVKPLAVSHDFKQELQKSMLLIYTNDQRDQDEIARSHEKKDKKAILQIAKEAHTLFLKEDIKGIGKLLKDAWEEKQRISPLITNPKINQIIGEIRGMGAYGWKLLGAGGCGFVLSIADPIHNEMLRDRFQDSILEFNFEDRGVSVIYEGPNEESRHRFRVFQPSSPGTFRIHSCCQTTV